MNYQSGQQFGSYRLQHLLGQGGFAEVYLGEHILLGTQTAIKILHQDHMRPDEQKTFAQEARTVANLIHPHIVRLLDFGFQDGTPFLVMDYAPGGSLRGEHSRGTRLPVKTVIEYVSQISEALQFAHTRPQPLIHRDIKPENILRGTHGELLVSDFGIALAVQSSRALSTQEVIGTAHYMAPEQIVGKPHLASDQYALGMAVYEWLAGTLPFRGSFNEICAQHIHAPIPSLQGLRPDISDDIEHILAKALAKKPEDRFPNVAAFASALKETEQATMRRALAPEIEPTRPAEPQPGRIQLAGYAPDPTQRVRPATSPATNFRPQASRQTFQPLITPPPVSSYSQAPSSQKNTYSSYKRRRGMITFFSIALLMTALGTIMGVLTNNLVTATALAAAVGCIFGTLGAIEASR